jgi:DUF1009 family protein
LSAPYPKLGIIAGAGEIPLLLAEDCTQTGRPFFVIGLQGLADQHIDRYPHRWLGIGEIGGMVASLKRENCVELTFAGRIKRPEWSSIKLDTRGTMLLPRVVEAARRGDDAIVRVFVAAFERDGFRVVGPDQLLNDLVAPNGPWGQITPTPRDLNDIRRAAAVLHALSPFDVGQGCIVCEGAVLAIEAAQGTDAMLREVSALPESRRGSPSARRGVLVKMPKINQERRADLPGLGPETIEGVSAAGLAGIAVEAGGALVVGRRRVVGEADARGLFVMGFGRDKILADAG